METRKPPPCMPRAERKLSCRYARAGTSLIAAEESRSRLHSFGLPHLASLRGLSSGRLVLPPCCSLDSELRTSGSP